jgi:hypothetical protein
MMAGVSEENRSRLAGILCVGGLLFVLLGSFLTLQHHFDFYELETSGPGPLPDDKATARMLQAVLFWLLVLLGVFMICTLAFLRWSRRYRKLLLARPRPPTPADDVWSQHRLPEEAAEPDPSPTDEGEGPG